MDPATRVVRVGDTVRRPRPERADEIVRLLRELRAAGFAGAPEVVDPDDGGDLVLRWVPGETILRLPCRLTDAQALSAARLVRGFHDASTRTTMGREAEIAAHGDLGAHNTVFQGEVAVAIVDWDDSLRPGTRASDFADAVWSCADLLSDEVPVERQRHLMEAMCEEYAMVTPREVWEELDAEFARAGANHTAAGRDRAAEIFADLRTRLAQSRRLLLGEDDTAAGGA